MSAHYQVILAFPGGMAKAGLVERCRHALPNADVLVALSIDDAFEQARTVTSVRALLFYLDDVDGLLELIERKLAPLDQASAAVLIGSRQRQSSALRTIGCGIQDFIVEEDLSARIEWAIECAAERHGVLLCSLQQQRDLDASRLRMQSIIEHSADAIVVVDAEGMIRLCNPAFERISNQSRNELIGQPFGIPLTGDECAKVTLLDHEQRQSTAELRNVNVEWDGESVHLVTLRDVTEQTLAQEALQRTERLATLGSFAAGISHEIKNILFPIRANIDGLQAISRSEEINKYVQAIDRSVSYLKSLNSTLQEMARDPNSDHSTSKAVTQVAEWWSELEPIIRESLPDHVSLQADIAADLPPAHIAATQLTQALLNLVKNAGEAIAEDAKGTVRVRAFAAGDGRHVRIVVEDDGEGMSPQVLARVLEPFYTRKKGRGGSGLGLNLVESAIGAVGGSIDISSELGEGTCVALMLPIARAEDGAAPLTTCINLQDARLSEYAKMILRSAQVKVLENVDESVKYDVLVTDVAPGARVDAAVVVVVGEAGDATPYPTSSIVLRHPRSAGFQKFRSVLMSAVKHAREAHDDAHSGNRR